MHLLKLLLVLVTVAFLGILIATAAPAMIEGRPIHGYALIAHASAAPAFSFCFAALAFLCRPKLECISSPLRRLAAIIVYLATLGFSFLTIVVIPVTMLPIATTDGLHLLLWLHQVFAVGMSVFMIPYIGMTIVMQNRLP